MRKDTYLKARAGKKDATRLARSSEIDMLISMASDKTIINLLRDIKKKLTTDWVSKIKPEDKERLSKARIAKELEQQERTKLTSVKAWRQWSSDDEKYILESTKTDEELAKDTGRSLWAVRSKRRKLYRRNSSLSATKKNACT